MNTTPFVSLKGIAKRWDGALGVEDINLDIPRGAFGLRQIHHAASVGGVGNSR